MNKKTKYAWDTSVFIAWLSAEDSAPLADIAAIIDEIESNESVLITSATAYTEILEAKYSKEQISNFDLFLKRSNVETIPVSVELAKKAGAIRDACLQLKPQRKLKTPDSQFIATAILFGADVLHSLDSDIVNMNGNQIVGGLQISRPIPFSGQSLLDFGR